MCYTCYASLLIIIINVMQCYFLYVKCIFSIAYFYIFFLENATFSHCYLYFVDCASSNCIVLYCSHFYCVLLSSMFILNDVYHHLWYVILFYSLSTYNCVSISIAHKQLDRYVSTSLIF